jgi:hypothetical protein
MEPARASRLGTVGPLTHPVRDLLPSPLMNDTCEVVLRPQGRKRRQLSLLEHSREPYWALGRPGRTAHEHGHMRLSHGMLEPCSGRCPLAVEELYCDSVPALIIDHGYSPGLGV